MNLEDEDVSYRAPAAPQVSRVVDTLSAATNVLVVDVSNLAWRSIYAHPTLKTTTNRISGHVFGSYKFLLSKLQHDLPPANWVLCFCYDGAEAKHDRRLLLPTYKGGRDEHAFNPCPDVNAALRVLPGIHIEHRRREADDAMAWAAERFRKPGRGVTVLSGDKDMWPLLRFPDVSVFSPNLDRFVTPDDIKKKLFTSYPKMVPLAKALFGDASDKIKGVERLFKAHVLRFLDVDGTSDLDGFLAVVAADPDVPLKTRTKLAAARAQLETALRVIAPDLTGFCPATVQPGRATEERRLAVQLVLNLFECKTVLPAVGCFFGDTFLTNYGTDQ